MNTRRRAFLLAVQLTLGAIALSACGDQLSPRPGADPVTATPTSQATTGSATSDAEDRGDPLVGNSATTTTADDNAVTRIHLIGDSITEGGYRYELFKLMVDSDVRFDFVGSLGDPPEVIADEYPSYRGQTFDSDHDGHPDLTTQAVADRMPMIMANIETPDMALIHLGTNDYEGLPIDEIDSIIPTSLAAMRTIVSELREANPDVQIFIAQIIPMISEFGPQNDYVRSLNAELAVLASTETSSASPILIVDMNTGFDDGHLGDPWHPNRSGAIEIAQRWLAAIRPR
ncbi:MAG: hypothetical protein GY708_09625 [Actinomycetia bacterium]|nr:hypothetical protein [Actinomycetes bacterium]